MIFLLFIAGLVGIYFSSQWLITTSLALGQKLGWSEAKIGFLIVGLGTSVPEIAISFFGLFSGQTGVLTGNIAGSCIANTLLVLGVGLCFSRQPLKGGRLDGWLYLVLLTLLFSVSILQGYCGRWMAVLLLLVGGFALFKILRADHGDETSTVTNHQLGGVWVYIAPVISLLGVVVAAKVIISSGLSLAKDWHLDVGFFGMSLVAIGTCLPEMVLAILSAKRGYTQLLVGNIIGSNISNITLGIALPALLFPFKTNMHNPVLVAAIMVLSTGYFLMVCSSAGKRYKVAGLAGLIAFVLAYSILFSLA